MHSIFPIWTICFVWMGVCVCVNDDAPSSKLKPILFFTYKFIFCTVFFANCNGIFCFVGSLKRKRTWRLPLYMWLFFFVLAVVWRAVDIIMNYVRIVWDSVKWVAANWSLNVCMQMYEMCGTACSLYLFVCHKNHTKSVTWNVWYFFAIFLNQSTHSSGMNCDSII